MSVSVHCSSSLPSIAPELAREASPPPPLRPIGQRLLSASFVSSTFSWTKTRPPQRHAAPKGRSDLEVHKSSSSTFESYFSFVLPYSASSFPCCRCYHCVIMARHTHLRARNAKVFIHNPIFALKSNISMRSNSLLDSTVGVPRSHQCK